MPKPPSKKQQTDPGPPRSPLAAPGMMLIRTAGSVYRTRHKNPHRAIRRWTRTGYAVAVVEAEDGTRERWLIPMREILEIGIHDAPPPQDPREDDPS